MDGSEESPVPIALAAFTVNVYDIPGVRPSKVIGPALLLAVMPPGAAVTIYDVIGLPPLNAGGAKYTVACPLPLTALPIIGASGALAGVMAADAVDAGPAPSTFAAVTLKV